MKRPYLFFVTLSIVFMTALAHAGFDEKVALKIGQAEKLAGGISVKFVEIVEDSRCPEGATCIWAGRAIVRIEVTENGSEPRIVDLEVGNIESTARFGKFVVKAEKLEPYPKAESQTDKAAYSATLSIERAGKQQCE